MARAKKTFLVSQYLERVSYKALERYQDLLRDFTRRRNGVYALYRGDRLYYVGLARDLRGRVNQHLKNRHRGAWDRFSMYLTIGDDHVRELESLVLRIVRPKGNKQIGKFKRAEDLRRALRRKAKQESEREIEDLFPRKMIGKRAKGKRASRGESGRPVLAAFPNRPSRLRASFKGKRFRARVLRSGAISVKGTRFNSPSMAAYHVIGRKRAINGWWFWHYERAPGDWIRLKELRR
jgi:hypothetical protein